MLYTELEKKLCVIGSLWKHSGASDKSHVILASGKHSNGFLNLSVLSSHPRVLREFTNILAESILLHPKHSEIIKNPQKCWLVGSAMGGIPVALQLSEQLNFRLAWTEKTTDDKMTFARFANEADKIENVLLIEDVLTTGSTTQKTIDALCELGLGNAILDSVALVINRTGKNEVNFDVNGVDKTFELLPALSLDFGIWNPEGCELCKIGSPAKKPKLNWTEFANDINEQLG